MKHLKLLLVFVALSLVGSACRKDTPEPNPNNGGGTEKPQQKSDVSFTLKLSMPQDLSVELQSLSLKLVNKETGEEIVQELGQKLSSELKLPQGLYTLSVSGKAVDKFKKEYILNALRDELAVESALKNLELKLSVQYKGEAFVIKEIFYSGSKIDNGGKGNVFSNYLILHNNTTEKQYADKLIFCGTAMNTKIGQQNYKAELPKVVVDFMFEIPGSGKDVPVEAGQDLVICMEAKDHHSISALSPDLTKANFEWFEPNERFQLTDNPEVPNMNILFKTSATFTMLHMRGLVSYFICKIPMSFEELMKTSSKEFTYPNPRIAPRTYPLIEDKWIIDGVELSDGEVIKHKALPISIDKSHNYVSKSRVGYILRRKVANKIGDLEILQDTNDSMNDFERDHTSSLL